MISPYVYWVDVRFSKYNKNKMHKENIDGTKQQLDYSSIENNRRTTKIKQKPKIKFLLTLTLIDMKKNGRK